MQKFNEVMWWTAWFTLLGFFHLFTQLCKDRFEYVSIDKYFPLNFILREMLLACMKAVSSPGITHYSHNLF